MTRFWSIVAVCAFLAFGTVDSQAQRFVYADFDTSGAVDFLDFSKLIGAFGGASNVPAQIDLNSDGAVDGEDAFLFADVFSDNASEANLTVSTGPNSNASLELDPTPDGFLVYLNGIQGFGGYRILLSMPDTVKVTQVEDLLGIGLLPVRQTANGVEIVGLVLGNKALDQSGLIARISFTADTTGVADTRGVAVSGVHLRGPRVNLGNHLFRGDRNTLPESNIKRVPEGDLLVSSRIFDLGELAVGETVTRTFDIGNTFDNQQAPGTSRKLAFELSPSDVSISVEPRTFGVLADTSTGLPTGGIQKVTATIAPLASGVFWHTVDIRTNRSERSVVKVHFRARVRASDLGARVRAFADFDSSGTVDYADFDALVRRFGSTPDSAKYDLDVDGTVDGDDAFLFADLLGGFTGRALFDTVRVVPGVNLASAVRVQDSGEEFLVSVRDLQRLGGYRMILKFDPAEVDLRWARDLAGGGALPIHKTATGAEIVGMGFGALVEHSGDRALARVSVRPLKGQADAASLVSVSGVVFRGARGERDSVGAVRIAANGLDASPRVIDFGSLRVGATAQKTFRIYNLNSASTSFLITSSDSLVTTSPKSVGNLGAGRTWDVKVSLSVVKPGPFVSTLNIAAIGADPSPITLSVKAFGAVVSASPDSLAFGQVYVGQNAVQSVAVTNPALAPFEITDLRFSGSDTVFVIDSAPTLPLLVSAEGGVSTLRVRFNPLVMGDVRDTLRIVGADTTFAISLSGKGLSRAAQLSAATLSFGSVDLGRDTTLTLRVSNVGNVPYILDSLTVGRRDTSFAGLSLPSFPDTLLSNGVVDTLTLRFHPDTTGVKRDTLRIYSADSVWAVPLSGTGLPRPVIEPPPVENILVVTFGGTITKSRNSLHFGKVAWGKTDSLKVRVQNRRSGNLTFRFSVTDSQIVVKPDSVQNLPPNQQWDVVLRITPTDSIQTLSEFRITTNEVGDGVTVIPIKSGGSRPVLSPTSLDFGAVGLDNGLSQNLTLTNTGHSRLVLETLALGSDSAFVLVNPPTLPLAVAEEGGTLGLQIRFVPNARGTFVGTLRFGGVDTVFSLTMSGRGREARVVLSPDSLAFGLLAVGQTDTLAMVLSNAGQDTVVVDSLRTLGFNTPFALIDSLSLPDSLAGGAARDLRVVFAPGSATSWRDTLKIIVGLDTLFAPISGTGTVARASLSTQRLDFGQPEVGRIRRDTVIVTNEGNVPFVIQNVALLNGNRKFGLLSGTELPHAITVGGTLVLPLQFAPDSTDARSDVLRIVARDTTYAVDLAGRGAPSIAIARRDTGLAVSHVRLDFGDLDAGQTGRRIVRVTNETSNPLAFSTSTGNGTLSVRPSSLAAVPPGIHWDLVAQWRPTDQSPLLTDLRVTSLGRTVSVPVGRKGIFAGLLTDKLAFGDVRLGKDETLVARVRNNGQGAAVIQSLGIDAQAGFTVVDPPNLPLVLQERDSLLVRVKFAPVEVRAVFDTLRIGGRDTSFTVALSGQGVQAVVSTNISFFDFGDRVVGTDSTAAVIFRNSGNGTFVLDSLRLESPQGMFGVASAPTFPDTLAANGGTDTVRVQFLPIDLGDFAGVLRVFGGAERFDVPLSGKSSVSDVTPSGITVAFGSAVSLSDSTLNFGTIPTGSTRKLSFVILNNRDSTLAVTASSTNAQVTVAPSSVGGLFPNQNATFTVSFTPVEQGETTVILNLTSNASADGTIRLRAQKNRPPVRVEPLKLAFGDVLVGTQDTLKTTITNPEILNFRVTAYGFGNRGPFALFDGPSVPDTVSANGGQRTLTVSFSPAARGAFVDTLQIVGTDRRFSVALSGTGLLALASASADSLGFGSVQVGQDSTRSVSVSNLGDVPLVLNQLAIDSAAFVLVDSLALPDTLAVGASQSVRVRFAPQVAGSVRGEMLFGFANQSVRVALGGNAIVPPRTEPGPIALDLDPANGDQGMRSQSVSGRAVLVDLVATDGALGKTGFEVVLRFDAQRTAYRAFEVVDLFEGATPLVTTDVSGEVKVSVVFFEGVTAARDSGSIGRVQFDLLGDASETTIQIASAQYALSTGPVALDIGAKGATVTVAGTTEPSADFNGDGEVNFSDFIAFAGKFGTKSGGPGFDARFDLDGNGAVGFSDFIIFAGKFGSKTGKPTLAKPSVN